MQLITRRKAKGERPKVLRLTSHVSRLAAFVLLAPCSLLKGDCPRFTDGASLRRRIGTVPVIMLLTAYGLVLTGSARAEDRFSVKYQHYEDDKSIYYKDAKGVTSDRWLIAISKAITEKTSLALNYGVDAISSASWKVDGVTSATKRAGEETRYSGGLGLNHTIGTVNYSANLGLSRENNYNSNYLSASVAKDYNKRNTTVALSVSKAWDDIYSTKIGDSRTFPMSKDTSTVGLSFTQALTPWTIAAIGHEYTMAEGYQAHPENVVCLDCTSINRAYTDEVHPETRYRNASVLRINRYLPWRGALHADYRYYHDSWGVGSNTLGLKYYQYLSDDLVLRLRGRFYTQGAADFYFKNPSATDSYPTIDGKLREFDSLMYGVKLIYNATKAAGKAGIKVGEKINLDLKWDVYQQADAITSPTKVAGPSTGLKASIVQVGLGMEF
ncbi:MAG: DUF3570 domain-containing protein [Deltaproteobacteria bacterium]|nr:DUF3570 domain-containing protein [Deltaproteobacteria bacterium]